LKKALKLVRIMTMANNPISSDIVNEDQTIEGPGSGMNGGASDSVIGICTDIINPTLSSYARVIVGARSSPIGLESPALGAAAYYVDYPNDSFDRSPVIFAEADTDAAVGEIFATTLNFSVTNESSDDIKIGEWLWGVAVPQSDLYYTTGATLETGEWRTNESGTTEQDTTAYIRFIPATKKECWNDTSSRAGDPLVVGARYRVEITIGDNTAGALTALTKTSTNDDQGVAPLSANTLGADQPFEFVAASTFMQQNIRTTLGTGYVQCGEMNVYGPLAT
jgi:hypothetical protein